MQKLNLLNVNKNMEEKAMIKKYVEYGLDSIDENLKVEMRTKDIALIYKTIQELMSFFHQRGHYEKTQDIHTYLGDKDNGMYSLLYEIRYGIFEKKIDDQTKEILDSDDLIYPDQKYYKK